MTQLLFLRVVISVLLVVKLSCSDAMAKKMSSDSVFASKLNKFTFAFNDLVKNEDSGNVISSPFSVYTALAMLGVGANNKTKGEISKVLQLEEEDVLSLLNEMKPVSDNLLQGTDESKLDIANKIWVQRGVDILPSYQDNVKKYFDVTVGLADFVENTESAREAINKWVEENTSGQIQNLFAPGSITKVSQLVLANAVYFKGQWKDTFDPLDTSEMDFFLNGKESVRANFMFRHGKADAGYDKEHNMLLLQLPYAGGNYSMVFAIPFADDADGMYEFEDLDEVEKKMQNKHEVFNKWAKILGSKTVKGEIDIFVPKFKLGLDLDLTATLRQMGLSDTLTPGCADFSGINGKQDLYVSSAVHKAYVEVDEKGTTAAAATGMVANTFSMFQTEITEVVLNHPFLFYITHKESNTIIFSGKMKNPLIE